jgi:hypothetical protein
MYALICDVVCTLTVYVACAWLKLASAALVAVTVAAPMATPVATPEVALTVSTLVLEL